MKNSGVWGRYRLFEKNPQQVKTSGAGNNFPTREIALAEVTYGDGSPYGTTTLA